MTSTIIPTDSDVLCGKDKFCLSHRGSRKFRDLIDTYVANYLTCKSKFEKMTITREIYEVVNQTSRFLRFNETDQAWEEISAMAARDKIGHSLRFSSRAKRRHLKRKAFIQSRSGSGSSNSSVSSSSAASTVSSSGSETTQLEMHSLVSLLERGATIESTPESIRSFETSSFSSQALVDFLKPDFTAQSETDLQNTISELKNLFVEEKNFIVHSDLADSFMDDILDALGDFEESQPEQPVDNLMSLLSEPLGEWD